MTTNPIPVPVPSDDDENDATPDATREIDGEEVLDPDVDADRVDSAEADRLASGADEIDGAAVGDERDEEPDPNV